MDDDDRAAQKARDDRIAALVEHAAAVEIERDRARERIAALEDERKRLQEETQFLRDDQVWMAEQFHWRVTESLRLTTENERLRAFAEKVPHLFADHPDAGHEAADCARRGGRCAALAGRKA